MDTVPGEQRGLDPRRMPCSTLRFLEPPPVSCSSRHARRVERLMLARRWWWSCVYVASTVLVFPLSFLADHVATLWQMALGWLLNMGYLLVVVKTRTRRGPWGSRFRSELQEPEFWRETRTLSGGRVGVPAAARSDVLDAARRDASDWLSGIGISTLFGVVFLSTASGVPSARPGCFVIGGAFVALTVWGLVRARFVMARLDRADPTRVDQRQRSA